MHRIIDLTVDVGNLRLCDKNNGGSYSGTVYVVRGETVLLRFHFVTVSGTTLTDYAIEAGATLQLGVKQPAKFGGEYLAFSDDDQWVDADWDDQDDATGKCCARLNLNTTTLAAAMGDVTDSLPALFQVEALTTDVPARSLVLCRFQGVIYNDVVRGTEGVPVPAAPTFLTAAQVQALLDAILSIPAGKRIVVDADGNITVVEVT